MMRSNKKILVIALFIASALKLYADKMPFERYQSIIDRMPFGQPPPGFDPTKNPDEVSKEDIKEQEEALTKEQEEIQKIIQFNAINRDPEGAIMVGFIDKSDSKSPKVYYMAVGETREGWYVREADSVEKTMTVEKNGVEVRLALGENSGSGAAKGSATAKSQSKSSKTLGSSGAERSALLANRAGDKSSDSPQSFRGRRERREAEERAIREENERMRAERERQAEEAAQRQAEEKAAREAERAEQREQLKAIQEELRRAREESAAARERAAENEANEEFDE